MNNEVLPSTKIFEAFDPNSPEVKEAAAAMNAYTRSLMVHRFTGKPKRGFLDLILPRCAPGSDGVDEAYLLYEIAEDLFEQRERQQQLAARIMTRRQWRRHWRYQRLGRRCNVRGETRDQFLARAIGVVRDLCSQIERLGQRN